MWRAEFLFDGHHNSEENEIQYLSCTTLLAVYASYIEFHGKYYRASHVNAVIYLR